MHYAGWVEGGKGLCCSVKKEKGTSINKHPLFLNLKSGERSLPAMVTMV